jgi:hypothetical protein
MKENIKKHLENYAISKKWSTDEKTLIEIITEGKEVHSEMIDEHRHWDDVFKVVEVNGMLIGYESAHTTGDISPREAGWEFDPSTICEVERKEIKTIVYQLK